MENNMVRVVKIKIHSGTFWVILGVINVENIVKLKLEHIRGFNLFVQ